MNRIKLISVGKLSEKAKEKLKNLIFKRDLRLKKLVEEYLSHPSVVDLRDKCGPIFDHDELNSSTSCVVTSMMNVDTKKEFIDPIYYEEKPLE